MYELIKEKMVKARKAHTCVWCAEDISVGHFCIYRAYKFEGDFNNDWMHNDCSLAMYETDEDICDGWEPGDFERGSTKRINQED